MFQLRLTTFQPLNEITANLHSRRAVSWLCTLSLHLVINQLQLVRILNKSHVVFNQSTAKRERLCVCMCVYRAVIALLINDNTTTTNDVDFLHRIPRDVQPVYLNKQGHCCNIAILSRKRKIFHLSIFSVYHIWYWNLFKNYLYLHKNV